MTSCPTANDLAELLDGTLAASRRDEVERHLDDCIACTELVGELARLVTPGVTARVWLDAQPRTSPEIVAVWRRAIARVAASHRDGVVHGALSPDCIAIGDDGEIAIAIARPAPSPYTAVEQLHGAPPSPRADQLALCAAMWEALDGKLPFRGTTPGARAVAMLTPPELPVHDRRVFGVLARGLLADPAARWPDLDALLAALDRPPRPSRAWWPWLALVVIAATVVILTR